MNTLSVVSRLNRLLPFKQIHAAWCKVLISSHSNTCKHHKSEKLCAGQRFKNLMDHYADKPAGMWHGLYHSRIYLKDLFDDGCDTDYGRQFARNWCKIRAYICGKDQLTSIKKEAISIECNCWCPSIPKEEFDDLCDIGANLNNNDINEICDNINQSFTIESRRGLLLNSLCGASLVTPLNVLQNNASSSYKYGVNQKEIDAFMEIAKYFGIDENTTRNIYHLYSCESQLKQKYDDFYYNCNKK